MSAGGRVSMGHVRISLGDGSGIFCCSYLVSKAMGRPAAGVFSCGKKQRRCQPCQGSEETQHQSCASPWCDVYETAHDSLSLACDRVSAQDIDSRAELAPSGARCPGTGSVPYLID